MQYAKSHAPETVLTEFQEVSLQTAAAVMKEKLGKNWLRKSRARNRISYVT